MSKILRFKEAPNISWTSLIGSSPGRMLSGRQSQINQKLKEAWFYEHLPVLFLWTDEFDENLLLNGAKNLHVLQCCYFLEFLCLKYTDRRFSSNTYAHGPFRLSEKRHICFLKFALGNSKKAKRHLFNSLSETQKSNIL